MEDQAAEEDTEPADVEVMALKGPTAMGMVNSWMMWTAAV